MKHEEVVATLKKISDNGLAIGISRDDLQELKSYVLIEITEGKGKTPFCTLTKKGRVMLKANLKE